VCICAARSGAAGAQTLGVKGGVTSSTVALELDPEPVFADAAKGFLAGGFLGIPVIPRLTLQFEALVVDRRTAFSDAPDSEARFTDRVRYLEVPMLARFQLFGGTRAMVFVEGGLGFSRMLTAREKYDGGNDDIAAAIESREASSVAGAAIEWRRVVAGVRYLHGFTDIYRAETFPAKQRTWQFSLGYRFR
jgi:hypothetical protein